MSNLKITLHDLLDLETGIFVEVKVESLVNIKELIHRKFFSINKFSQAVKLPASAISLFLSQKRRISLKNAFKIARSLDLNPENVFDYLSSRGRMCKISINKLPITVSSPLASLIGHCFSDGHLGVNGFEFTNKSTNLLEEVTDNLKSIGFDEIKYRSHNHKATTIRFSRFIRDILIMAGGPSGNKVLKEFKIPDWILNGNKDTKRAFLRALFDDESSVKVNSREITIKFSKLIKLQNNLLFFLARVNKMLKEFDIVHNSINNDLKLNTKNGFTLQKILRICGIKNFINLKNNIGFTNQIKVESLNRLISSTQVIKLRKNEGTEKILLVLHDKKLIIPEIANTVKLTPLATWKHLIKMERKNLVGRIRPKRRNEHDIWMVNYDQNNKYHIW